MKITITVTETNTREIEVPTYLQSTKYPQAFMMLVGEKCFLKIDTKDIDFQFGIYPSIEIMAIYQLQIYTKDGFNEISEDQFKQKFTETTLKIESLLN